MKKHIFLSVLVVAVVAILGLLIYGIICDNSIKTTEYSVRVKDSKSSIHFVMISDIHNKSFGKNNDKLLLRIKDENPDFIAVCGDMMTKWNNDTQPMKDVLQNLSDIAPTYVCLGNHDLAHKDEIDFKEELSQTGAVLLDNEAVFFEKNGEKVMIGGLTDYPYYEFNMPDFDTPERYFWEDFNNQSKDHPSILLHHQPEYISTLLQDSNVDLVLCGHTHGGQIQLPIVGGVFSPNQGFFPKYDVGEFSFGESTMIVSSGLGNNVPIPRFNNSPEICVIDIE